MIFETIELENLGALRSIRLGPLSPGLNLIAAPNERGKTTLVRALHHLWFSKHNSKDRELRRLLPVGAQLGPRIAVEGRDGRNARFRLEKRYWLTPSARLFEEAGGAWQPKAEAGAVESWLEARLQAPLPEGQRLPLRELLEWLWPWQGEELAWPEAGLGEAIRRPMAGIELDPWIDRLREALAAASEDLQDRRGGTRAGSGLAEAERRLEESGGALSRIEAALSELEELVEEHREAHRDLTAVERRLRTASGRKGEIEKRLAGVREVRAEIEAKSKDLAAAKSLLEEIASDRGKLESLGKESEALQQRIEALQKEEAREQQQLGALREAKSQAKADLERLRRLGEWTRLRSESERLAKLAEELRANREEVLRLEGLLAGKPAVDARRIAELEALEKEVQGLEAERAALGLRLLLFPERPEKIEAACDGEAARERTLSPDPSGIPLRADQRIELLLSGWGRIEIFSGSRELSELVRRIEASQGSLAERQRRLGIGSLAEARERHGLQERLEERRGSQRRLLSSAGMEDSAPLEGKRSEAESALRLLEASLHPSPEERALPVGEVQERAERAEKRLASWEEKLRSLEEELAQRRNERLTAERMLAGSRSAEAALSARYPRGVSVAEDQARSQAESLARQIAQRQEALPPNCPDLERELADLEQEIRALEEEVASRTSRRDRMVGRIELLGGEGLAQRRQEIARERREAEAEGEKRWLRAWAARLVAAALRRAQTDAGSSVAETLSSELSRLFGELSGDPARRVFLGSCLQIEGVGPDRVHSIPFEQLSQGSKELLLLCLRLSVAEALARWWEPFPLILDDALVNADADRRQRVFPLLRQKAERFQILILTCHPEAYLGLNIPRTIPQEWSLRSTSATLPGGSTDGR